MAVGKMKFVFKIASPLLAAAFLAACSADNIDPNQTYQERPVEELYSDAHQSLLAKEYETAATKFDEVERQHPYSIWATKAQLMAAYALYENEKYDDAIIALDRFTQLHPSNKDIPYAIYLKGLSYYEQISDVGRDQMITDLSQKTFKELIKRFPTSQYARDARIKLELTYDHLAGKEMEIGRYYTKNHQCIAALSRFKAVVEQYDTTTHVPEALHRMAECYTQLGLEEEAKRVAAVLGHNFPGSEWYVDTYEIVERKRLRPKEGDNWYWPFDNKDTLEILAEEEGKQVEEALLPEEKAVQLPSKGQWWEVWK